MKYILVALKAELPEHNLDPTQYKVWFTGVGKINATIFATLACIQSDCEAVINYGTAGTLDHEHVGKLLQVGKVRQRDMDARPQSELGVTPFEEGELAGDIVIGNSAYVCSSGDTFVKEKTIEFGNQIFQDHYKNQEEKDCLQNLQEQVLHLIL